MSSYIHTHIHTQYSLLDGVILLPELMIHLKELGIDTCAITDHGWMAGVIDFYKICKKNNIKPIIGTEAYITENKDDLPNEDKVRDNMHIVLLAKDNIGYTKLLELVSRAALHNFYYKPRIYKEHLRELASHVVCTSACPGGIIAKKLKFNTVEDGSVISCVDEDNIIDRELDFYLDIFKEDFYLELQVWDDGKHYQSFYNQFLLEKGKQRGIPFIITADCHYLKQEEFELHELLMAMQFKMSLDEYRASSNIQYGPYFYVASPQEMLARAQSIHCEEAYYNTIDVGNKCNVEIELGKFKELIFDITKMDDYQDFLKYKERRI